jgi:hypothetical protein
MEASGQLYAAAALPSEKNPRYQLDMRLGGGPQTWRRENYYPYRDSYSDRSAVQPVASSYSDCAVMYS